MISLRDLGTLTRIQGAGGFAAAFTASGAVAGCRDPLYLVLFAIAGVLTHAGGFALNEVCDLPRDRLDAGHQGTPLVSGRVSVREAGAYAAGFIITAFLLLFALALMKGSGIAEVVLPVGFGLGILYDTHGKRVRWVGLGMYVGGTVLPVMVPGLLWAGLLTPHLELLMLLLIPASAAGLFAGDYKDLDTYEKTGEGNLWRVFGVKAGPGWDKQKAIKRANAITAGALALVLALFFWAMPIWLWAVLMVVPFLWFRTTKKLWYWRQG